MSQKVLMIDDAKSIMNYKHYGTYIVVARTYDDGMDKLVNQGPWKILLLDNDGLDPDDPYRTGTKIIDWLEENPEYLPEKIIPITMNPGARAHMEQVIERLYGPR